MKITSTYSTQEQAKKLKEKGCDIDCSHAYYQNGESELLLWIDGEPQNTELYKAPEYWQVIEWFIQRHNLWIRIHPSEVSFTDPSEKSNKIEWVFLIYEVIEDSAQVRWKGIGRGKTRNNAYSLAIDYALNTLI